MSARQRFPKKEGSGSINVQSGKEQLSEDEAVEKASRVWVKTFAVAFFISIGVIVVILVLIPPPVTPEEMESLAPPPEFQGVLEPNDILSNMERIYRDEILGPESIAVDGEHLYTGTSDGWVVHAYRGEVQKLVRFGKGPCGDTSDEPTCGRPLGVRLHKDGTLVVADGYYGLFKVNVVTGDYTTLYSSDTPVNGKKSKLVNDLDIGPDGKIYFTDSSTEFNRNEFHMCIFSAQPAGRLMMYDPATEKTTMLVDKMIFPNGVQMTSDKSAILIAETMKARILKYDINSKKVSVWMDNLPGMPDNLRYDKLSGTYWIGLAVLREPGKSLIDILASRPWLRGMAMKLISLHTLEWVKENLSRATVKAMILQVDTNGKILRSLQLTSGSVPESISEVAVGDQALYMGSYNGPYIRKLYKKYISSP